MSENMKNPAQDFNRIYTDVSDSIAAAMREIKGIHVEREDGKQELGRMMEKLRTIQSRFNEELTLLEKHAEWDKFTIAFFGETNAGKSTIIESLRILFNEQTRQELLQKNAHDLARYEHEMTAHVNQVREGINSLYAKYTEEIASIKSSATTLANILREEYSVAVKRKLWFHALAGLFVGSGTAVVLTTLLGN